MKLSNKFKQWYYGKNSTCDPIEFEFLLAELIKKEKKMLKKVKNEP